MLGSVRHEVRIRRPAAEVWELVGDPARLHEWFPGLVSSAVEGRTRTVVTRAGLTLPEELLVLDPIARRLQYRIDTPLFRHHRGTVDVIDLEDGTCLVVYATESDPRTMALMIGAGCREALGALRSLLERQAA